MTTPDPSDFRDPVQHAVRRHVGVAALRQLRRMVDAEQVSEEEDRRFVRRFLVGFGLVVLAALAGWLWFRGVI